MDFLLGAVGVTAVVVAVTAVAKRLGLLRPILLVVVGIALSFTGLPTIDLHPELVLAGVLPPLLYAAAVETSVPAFRYNLRPILLLAVGLVLFTAAAVGLVLHAVIPGMPMAAAFALGAVVAPTDAVAATTIARRVGLPRRMVTILEGESLVNDATALVILRVAAAAAVGHSVGALEITADAVLSGGGGLVVGGLAALVFAKLHRWTTDPLLDNSLSLLTPFVTYFAAEAIDASGITAVVVCGLYLGHRWPMLLSAASRLQMDAFWRMVTFLLEGAVFLLVGLQLRHILADVDAVNEVFATVAIVVTVLLARFVWIYPATYLTRLVPRVRERDPAPPPRVPTVLAWAGMRGVVTLAAAMTLPADFPNRALCIWLAFVVIVTSLLGQGFTLGWLIRRLRMPPDDATSDMLAEANVQQAASRAAAEVLEANGEGVPEDVAARLREKVEARARYAWERLGDQTRETPVVAYRRVRRMMVDAEREVFLQARDAGRIPEEILVRAQRDLDLEESLLTRE